MCKIKVHSCVVDIRASFKSAFYAFITCKHIRAVFDSHAETICYRECEKCVFVVILTIVFEFQSSDVRPVLIYSRSVVADFCIDSILLANDAKPRRICRRFVQVGYILLACDFYRRAVQKTLERVLNLVEIFIAIGMIALDVGHNAYISFHGKHMPFILARFRDENTIFEVCYSVRISIIDVIAAVYTLTSYHRQKFQIRLF